MKPNITVTFDPEIQPQLEMRPGSKFVCVACCDLVQIRPCRAGDCCIETWCPAGHPQVLIIQGKVVGTSA